ERSSRNEKIPCSPGMRTRRSVESLARITRFTLQLPLLRHWPDFTKESSLKKVYLAALNRGPDLVALDDVRLAFTADFRIGAACDAFEQCREISGPAPADLFFLQPGRQLKIPWLGIELPEMSAHAGGVGVKGPGKVRSQLRRGRPALGEIGREINQVSTAHFHLGQDSD